MAIDKLNKTFVPEQVLEAEELNLITGKVDEIIDNIPDVSGFITETKADSKYATKSDLGDIETILDNIIGG